MPNLLWTQNQTQAAAALHSCFTRTPSPSSAWHVDVQISYADLCDADSAEPGLPNGIHKAVALNGLPQSASDSDSDSEGFAQLPVEEEEEVGDGSNVYSSTQASGAPRPLEPQLVTLSLLPRSQWQSLVHLDAIKVVAVWMLRMVQMLGMLLLIVCYKMGCALSHSTVPCSAQPLPGRSLQSKCTESCTLLCQLSKLAASCLGPKLVLCSVVHYIASHVLQAGIRQVILCVCLNTPRTM